MSEPSDTGVLGPEQARDEAARLHDLYGVDLWIVLCERVGSWSWRPNLDPAMTEILVHEGLVTPVPHDHPDAPGTPTDKMRAIVVAILDGQEELAARYDEKGEPEMAAAIRRAFVRMPPELPQIPSDPPDLTTPEGFSAACREILDDPARLQHATERLRELQKLYVRASAAIEKLPQRLDVHYRGELRAIGKDLVHDLELGKLSDEEINVVLLAFLQRPDDDDDQSSPTSPPPPREMVPT